ncbi:hypothetical protein ScPMuIL_001884 [Solemya velum]
MGVESTLSQFAENRDVKILLVGKRTVVYTMKLSDVTQKIPNIGFDADTDGDHDSMNAETYDDYTLGGITPWDYGGRMGIRPLFNHFAFRSHARIVVVDCEDREGIVDVQSKSLELGYMRIPGPHCILVKNMIQNDAMTEAEITKALCLSSLTSYKIFPVNFEEKDSLMEPTAWLYQQLQRLDTFDVKTDPTGYETPTFKKKSKFSFFTSIFSGMKRKIKA